MPANNQYARTWSSSNTAAVTISPSGNPAGTTATITGAAAGTSTITVTAGGATHSITVTVVEPASGSIPIKTPNDGNAFKPLWNDDPMLGDGHYEHVFYPDRSLPAFNVFFHNGSIHLEDIISDGNYAGVTAVPSNSKYAPYITVGVDKCGHPSIIFNYIPTEAEFRALVAALANPDDDFFIPVQLNLTRGGQTATITINMYYWESMLVAME